ncbi:MAG TPA: hypothetical protein VK099_05185 [Alcanivoracaceae bacterium]|nr:hypothetical protein [Alcanivoracaceae bacterium]
MFKWLAVLTIVICAAPLCLALTLGLKIAEWPDVVAYSAGIFAFVVSTGFLSKYLVFANVRKQSA